jgi:hypothetical protein
MQTFTSGANRAEEPTAARYDLIPLAGLDALAETCAEGAAKYGISNWKKGIPSSNLMNHALTHLRRYLGGDASEDHLAHAAWNILVMIHNDRIAPQFNDIAERSGEGNMV